MYQHGRLDLEQGCKPPHWILRLSVACRASLSTERNDEVVSSTLLLPDPSAPISQNLGESMSIPVAQNQGSLSVWD